LSRIIRIILLTSALLLLTPWLTSYAHGTSNSAGNKTVHIEAAEPSAAPSAAAFGKAIGGVTAGDLFYIDATDNARDMSASLYLTNAHELTPCLRYLIFEVGIYFEGSDGQWRKLSSRNGEPLPNTYITLRNSPVSLILTGHNKYKVTVDSGSFYCLTHPTNINNVSPQFYLSVEPVQMLSSS
jgi:hypothetical protein